MLMSWRKCSRDMTRTEFEHISVLIRGRIVALARRFARAADLPDPAEDIAQETLEALWRLCEKGYPVRDPEALAVKIAKNICVMHYRRRRIVPARNEETRMEEDTVVCIPAGLRRHRPCCLPAPHRVWQ